MELTAYQEMAACERDHWWYRARRNILRDLLARHAPKQPSVIVEIGCGSGGNLPMLGEFGTVIGVESSATAIALAATYRGFDIRAGMLPDLLPVRQASCSWLCLFDVLEHVDDDIVALKACRSLLSQDGAILISVPAYHWLWSAHDKLHHHRRRYSCGQLISAVRASGLEVHYVTCFNTLLFPLAVLGRIVDRLRGSARPSGGATPPRLVNEMLFWLFDRERWLLRWLRLPFGLSIFAVCHLRND